VGEATLKHTPIDRLEREAVLIRVVEVLVLEVKCFNAKLWHAGSGPGIRSPSPKRARSWLKWKYPVGRGYCTRVPPNSRGLAVR